MSRYIFWQQQTQELQIKIHETNCWSNELEEFNAHAFIFCKGNNEIESFPTVFLTIPKAGWGKKCQKHHGDSGNRVL